MTTLGMVVLAESGSFLVATISLMYLQTQINFVTVIYTQVIFHIYILNFCDQAKKTDQFNTATKIPLMYFFSGNKGASAPISTFMCL
jgi:hypothetical protein